MLRNRQRAQAVAAFWEKPLDDREWYAVDRSGDNAEIRIFDVIGWPFIEADAFLNDLAKIDAEELTVRINSPGGDVFDGTAIYDALEDHPAKITTKVSGLAASMASVIALVGDRREITKGSHYMIHNPWTFAIGDENELQKSVDLLKKIGGGLLDIYAEKTGRNRAAIKQQMNDETWFRGKEAVDAGFMQAVSGAEPEGATARFNLAVFENPPTGGNINKRDLERSLMQDAGLSRAMARRLLHGGFDSLITQDADDEKAVEAIDHIIHNMRI